MLIGKHVYTDMCTYPHIYILIYTYTQTHVYTSRQTHVYTSTVTITPY